MALQNIHIWSDGNIKTLWRLFGNYSVGISHVTTTNFTEMASSSAWNTSVPQISMWQFVLFFYPFLVWTFRFQFDKRCFSYENPFGHFSLFEAFNLNWSSKKWDFLRGGRSYKWNGGQLSTLNALSCCVHVLVVCMCRNISWCRIMLR